MLKTSDVSAVCEILDHDRAVECWVLAPVLDKNGQPAIDKIARICWVYPRDGAGTLRVAVTDWGKRTPSGEPAHYINKAGGYGYDKRTAALDGCTVGGVELGDHCDPGGKPRLTELARSKGWMIIGSVD